MTYHPFSIKMCNADFTFVKIKLSDLLVIVVDSKLYVFNSYEFINFLM